VSAVATRPRLAFLGVGWIGQQRLDAVRDLCEVTALADPARPDCLDSLDELLAHDPDGIVIATPSGLHAQQALTAFEHGVAVFCQKPLARTAAEAREVVDAARWADRLLSVDLCYRHVEAFRRARERVLSGALGDVFAAELEFHNAYGPDKAWSRDPDLAGGGCVIDLGLHLVDLAVWTLGLTHVERVDSRLVGAPVEHYATAQLDSVRIACSWNLHAGRDAVISARFHGTDGGVSVENVGGSFYDFRADLHRGAASETLVLPPDAWGGRAIRTWATQLAVDRGFDESAEELVALHAVLDRIYGR
jgi:predicted dehydrogenase